MRMKRTIGCMAMLLALTVTAGARAAEPAAPSADLDRAAYEHLFPGSPREMITVYYLAAGRLQATHYCSIGNQPAYRLAAGSTPADIRMEFAGGTGFDPQTDPHAHGVEIRSQDAGHIEGEWHFQKGAQPSGSKRMTLARAPEAG